MNTTPIPFVKAHGHGNDFLIVDSDSVPKVSDEMLARLSAAMCHRHRGVGADGLVLLLPGTDYPQLDFSIRLFNSDGSEAGMSGNGIRCAAAVLHWRQPSAPQEVVIGSSVGRRALRLLERDGARFRFSAEMGIPTFTGESIPFLTDGLPESRRKAEGLDVVNVAIPVEDRTLAITALNLGNPQCIAFVEDFNAFDWKHYGRALESHPRFPQKTNVEFVRCLHRHRVEIRIWERGAGHTESSGTGSIASALGAILNGHAESPVRVLTEGGELEVAWAGLGEPVFLTGEAEVICEGTFHASLEIKI